MVCVLGRCVVPVLLYICRCMWYVCLVGVVPVLLYICRCMWYVCLVGVCCTCAAVDICMCMVCVCRGRSVVATHCRCVRC